MDLAFSARQLALAEAVRALCEDRSDPGGWESLVASEPGYDRDLWSELLQSGLAIAGFSERLGGSGGDLCDLAVVVEGLARIPVPTPLLNGLILSGQLLSSTEAAWLDDLFTGSRRFAACVPDLGAASQKPGLTASPGVGGEHWTLDGLVGFVPYAASADELVVVVPGAPGGETGAELFVVDAGATGVSMDPVPTVGGDRRCHVRFTSVVVPAERVATPTSSAPGWLSDALDVARLMVAADMVGAAAASLEHATVWARERVQFATPIGSFQAVQHRLADSLIDVTAARDGVYDALGRLDRHEPERLAVAAAKAFASDACRRVTASAHQVCGGEGIYADQPVHLWHRRVAGLVPELGTVHTHREAVAASLLD